jgi:peptidoglycan/LPS O-acetylase OafA/YrhL/4-amino-4-deoxy-L-arabinose transferase-like glycosyltransferase
MTATAPVAERGVTGVEGLAIPIVANPRFPLVDGVRAMAALMVLVTHVSFITRANIDNPLGPEMARMNTGVAVFFVLSGFLLYRPFVVARLTGDERPDTAPYLWRRLLRIYPAYWVVLAVVVLFGPATIPDVQSLVLWGSLAHVLSPDHFFGPLLQSYTLGVEVCFYLFLPVWAWFVRRLPGPVVRTELLAVAVLGAAGFGWQLFCLSQTGALESVWRNNLPGFIDHFAVGMAIAVVHASGRRGLARLERVPAGAWFGLAGVAMLVMSRGLGIERTAFFVEWWQDLALHVLGLVLAIGLILPAVVGPVDRGVPRRFLALRAVAWTGVVSYGVYLWHEFLLDRWVAWRWTPPFLENPAPFGPTLAFTLLGSVAVASVSWLAFERPLLRLKRLVRSTAHVLDGHLGARLLALTAVGLAVRIVFVLGWRRFDAVGGDPYWYHQAANLLADGEGFVHVFRLEAGVRQPGADHPPAYVVWLALSSLVGLRSLLAHQLWTCVLGALAVPFCGLAGARLGGRRTALVAALLAAVSPLLWVYDALLLSETLAVTSMAAAASLALKVRDERASDLRAVVALGVALGVLTLTRAEALLLVPVVLLAATGRRALRPLLAGVGAVGVVVGPWVVANMVRFEHPATLSTQLGTTLAHANCDDTYHGEFLGWWSYPCAASIPQPPGDASAADLAYREHALEYVGDNAGRLPVVVAARVGRTFGLYDPVDQSTLDRVEGRPKYTAAATTILWYPTAVLAVVGWRVLRRRGWTWRDLAPLWSPVACVLVTVIVFYGTTRFRALAEPAFVLLAAAALTPRAVLRR